MCTLCGSIPKSKIALNKLQFDAVLVHVSRGLYRTNELQSDAVEMHTEFTAQAMSTVCTTEASSAVAVVSSHVQTCPATHTDVTGATSNSGVHAYLYC